MSVDLATQSPALPAAKGPGKQPFDRGSALYCHVLVRTDLSLAQQAVQAIHAAMACVGEHGGLTPDTRLVLLGVSGHDELIRWARRLTSQRIAYSLFEEPDHGIGPSALATRPGLLTERKGLGRLPLWSPGLASNG